MLRRWVINSENVRLTDDDRCDGSHGDMILLNLVQLVRDHFNVLVCFVEK